MSIIIYEHMHVAIRYQYTNAFHTFTAIHHNNIIILLYLGMLIIM